VVPPSRVKKMAKNLVFRFHFSLSLVVARADRPARAAERKGHRIGRGAARYNVFSGTNVSDLGPHLNALRICGTRHAVWRINGIKGSLRRSF
jgi:hypothetical protein